MNAISTVLTSSRVNVFRIQGVLCRRKSVHAVLSRYLRCGEVVLKLGAFGKPKLLRPASEFPIEFSVSHCRDRCLVAISHGGVVGIDVERRRWIGDLDAIASIYFMIYGKWITLGAISLKLIRNQLENGWNLVLILGHFSD